MSHRPQRTTRRGQSSRRSSSDESCSAKTHAPTCPRAARPPPRAGAHAPNAEGHRPLRLGAIAGPRGPAPCKQSDDQSRCGGWARLVSPPHPNCAEVPYLSVRYCTRRPCAVVGACCAKKIRVPCQCRDGGDGKRTMPSATVPNFRWQLTTMTTQHAHQAAHPPRALYVRVASAPAQIARREVRHLLFALETPTVHGHARPPASSIIQEGTTRP